MSTKYSETRELDRLHEDGNAEFEAEHWKKTFLRSIRTLGVAKCTLTCTIEVTEFEPGFPSDELSQARVAEAVSKLREPRASEIKGNDSFEIVGGEVLSTRHG